ncbi:MAG: HNH endonuclease [Planctomycetia bacterium]|nr:HNH endonuclease [Planctomycetia bacterium]
MAVLLAACHRRCCICHRFCGVKIETDHIQPAADEGDDNIANAIPVCFDCHAEIHTYNDKHPRGRKFTPEELVKHKEQWLKMCAEQPIVALLRSDDSDGEVGPLQALVDEIEFNIAVAQSTASGDVGCPFRDDQFSRAIRTGSLALLAQDLKTALIDAHVAVGRANTVAVAAATKRAGGVSRSVVGVRGSSPAEAADDCVCCLERAHQLLLRFLGHESTSA